MHLPFPYSHFLSLIPAQSSKEQVLDLVHSTLDFQLSPHFNQQLICTTILFEVTTVVGLYRLAVRLSEGALWAWRTIDTRGTRLVIPNPIIGFQIIELAYVTMFLAWMWCLNSHTNQAWLPFVSGIIFLPLQLGIWCLSFGILYSVPGTVFVDNCWQPYKVKRSSALPLNLLFFGLPLGIVPPIVFTSIMGGVQVRRAQHAYNVLAAKITSLPGRNDDAGVVPQALLAEAAHVWQLSALGWWWAVLGYAIWAALAGCFVIMGAVLAGYLCRNMRQHLHDKKHLERSGARIAIPDDLDNHTYHYPAVKMPESGVVWTISSNDAATHALRRSFWLVVIILSLIGFGVSAFFGIALRHALLGYELIASADPGSYGPFIASEMMACVWVSCIAGVPLYLIITSERLRPLVDGFVCRRELYAARRNVPPHPPVDFDDYSATPKTTRPSVPAYKHKPYTGRGLSFLRPSKETNHRHQLGELAVSMEGSEDHAVSIDKYCTSTAEAHGLRDLVPSTSGTRRAPTPQHQHLAQEEGRRPQSSHLSESSRTSNSHALSAPPPSSIAHGAQGAPRRYLTPPTTASHANSHESSHELLPSAERGWTYARPTFVVERIVETRNTKLKPLQRPQGEQGDEHSVYTGWSEVGEEGSTHNSRESIGIAL